MIVLTQRMIFPEPAPSVLATQLAGYSVSSLFLQTTDTLNLPHITSALHVYHLTFTLGGGVTGESAAGRVTAAQVCVSTFVS